MERDSSRLDVIFTQIKNNASSAEMEIAIRHYELMRSHLVGTRSEERAERYFNVVHWVKQAVRTKTNGEYDKLGIDFFLKMQPFSHLPKTMPAQIVSSGRGVDYFRNSGLYSLHDKKIFVLNAGPRVSRSKFKEAFLHEQRRIKDLYKKR